MAEFADHEDDFRFGGKQNPVLVDDDDDGDLDDLGRRQQEIAASARAPGWTRRNSAVKLEYFDLEDIEDKLSNELKDVIDLTDDPGFSVEVKSPEPSLFGEDQFQQHVRPDGLILTTGMLVELRIPIEDRFPGRFLKIRCIEEDQFGHVVLRGWAYARVRELGGVLPRKLNEICLLSTIDTTDPRPWQAQALVDVEPGNVSRVRALRTTNTSFPEFRFDNSDLSNGKQWVANHSPLVCRKRFAHYFHGPRKMRKKPCEFALFNFSEKEADEKFRVSDALVVNKWRGGKTRGGSSLESREFVISLDSDDDAKQDPQKLNSKGQLVLTPGQTYTVGDTFAGAGGASRGISRAGLELAFAVDHWDHAVSSLKMNFQKTDVHQMDITDFIVDKDVRYRVDMLHLSPPCQVWSPAHTTVGKNDEMNMAALFSCTDLIKKTKPRLFTLEQTFGMIHDRFKPFFNTLISGFTTHGYSVRWKVVNLATYGLPQPRKRLIIIGAGPGERLPAFPRPTHSEDGKNGLRCFVTAKEALAPIRRGGFKTHPLNQKKYFDSPRNEWDPDRPVPRTITCSGGQNYHWKGHRDFTFLEYALLQGFPSFHKFHPSHVKKQIGNAFPSSIVRLLYKHLASELDRYDNVDSSSRIKNIGIPISQGPNAPALIIISSDSDADPDDVIFVKASSVRKPKRVADDEPAFIRTALKRQRTDSSTPARQFKRHTTIAIKDDSNSELEEAQAPRRWSAASARSVDSDAAYLSDGTVHATASSSATPEISEPRTPSTGVGVRVRHIIDLTGKAPKKKNGTAENPVVL